jgi:hypothetical protein
MFATINKRRVSPANKLTQEVINILNSRNNYVHRINNAPTQRRKNTVTKGFPDIAGTSKKGLFLGVEIKIGNDIQSIEQQEFEISVKNRGGFYFVISSIEQLYNFINIYYANI